ncbi:GMC family oxidoreductase, partial [Paracoccus homiensis]
LCFNSCRPDSRGSVGLSRPEPGAAPDIRLNFLATERDRREAVEASRLMRRLMQAPALSAITAEEISPGEQCQDDQAMLDYVRQNGGSIYHLCGTCAMGPDADTAVVDQRLRVHGVPGLRVIDASVFPNITSGNLNAPVMMLAERAAAMIAEDRKSIRHEVRHSA